MTGACFVHMCFAVIPQQQRAEQEEEFITNRLTKRLTQLKQEKQSLANEVPAVSFAQCYSDPLQCHWVGPCSDKFTDALVASMLQVEQEEEYLVNTLQKKLTAVSCRSARMTSNEKNAFRLLPSHMSLAGAWILPRDALAARAGLPGEGRPGEATGGGAGIHRQQAAGQGESMQNCP